MEDKKSTESEILEHMICEHCLSTIFSDSGFKLSAANEDQNEFTYATTFQQISLSARQGCHWCQLILNQPDAFESLEPTDTVNIEFRPSRQDESFSPKGRNRYDLFINGWRLNITAFTDELDLVANIVTARELQHQVGSENSFRQARMWIKDCAHHRDCGQQDKHKLPTRVVEVSPATEPGAPRLLESNCKMGHYAALSYCWGMEQECVTGLDNLEQFLDQLPMQRIAKTIGDAIECTKKLGIDYLWVDALCIIQDSAEDKIRELASIRHVFQAALVTIVAASASDASQGFLEDRAPPQPSYKVPARTKSGECGTISLRPEGWYSHTQEPVTARAWTLEERLLSPRLLIYASHTLQWRCQTESKNLGNSMHIPAGSTDLSLPISFSKPRERKFSLESQDRDISDNEMGTWMDVISAYSGRTSTLPEDRLRALSGLAEEYHLRYQVGYLAGLWDGPLLPASLLWELGEYGRPNEDMYLAPTWSWASLKTAVSFTEYDLNRVKWYDVDVLDHSIQLKSGRLPFGQVTDGFLKLKAHVKQALYKPPNHLCWVYDIDHLEWTNVRVAKDDRMIQEFVICLAIVRREYLYEGEIFVAVDGLLIAPAQGEGGYKRIGTFAGAEEKDFEDSPSRVVTLI